MQNNILHALLSTTLDCTGVKDRPSGHGGVWPIFYLNSPQNLKKHTHMINMAHSNCIYIVCVLNIDLCYICYMFQVFTICFSLGLKYLMKN
jgi:hypothetical protein